MAPPSLHFVLLVSLFTASVSTPTWFNASSVVVLRVGNGVAFTPGTAAPLFLDEYSPVEHSQVASISSVSLSPLSCTLSAGSTSTWLYDEEGIPQRSADGGKIVLPCYGSLAGMPLALNAVKYAAVVSPDWTVALYSGTSALGSSAGSSAAPNALRTIASPDGVSFYWAVAGATWSPTNAAWIGTSCYNQYVNKWQQSDHTATGVYKTTSSITIPSTIGDNCWGDSNGCGASSAWWGRDYSYGNYHGDCCDNHWDYCPWYCGCNVGYWRRYYWYVESVSYGRRSSDRS